jgi:hypothetical protein
MKKLLYKYLNAFYVLDKQANGFYAIYKDEGDGLVKQHNDNIVRELVEIFGYGYTRTKWCIDSWAKTIIPHVDLRYYWGLRNLDSSVFEFPIARSISASLIGGDLVRVEPMSAPTGNLFYLDYQYGQIDHPTPDYLIGGVDPANNDSRISIAKVKNPDRNETIRKWVDSGLLDDFDYRKESLAALYEAQTRMLLE